MAGEVELLMGTLRSLQQQSQRFLEIRQNLEFQREQLDFRERQAEIINKQREESLRLQQESLDQRRKQDEFNQQLDILQTFTNIRNQESLIDSRTERTKRTGEAAERDIEAHEISIEAHERAQKKAEQDFLEFNRQQLSRRIFDNIKSDPIFSGVARQFSSIDDVQTKLDQRRRLIATETTDPILGQDQEIVQQMVQQLQIPELEALLDKFGSDHQAAMKDIETNLPLLRAKASEGQDLPTPPPQESKPAEQTEDESIPQSSAIPGSFQSFDQFDDVFAEQFIKDTGRPGGAREQFFSVIERSGLKLMEAGKQSIGRISDAQLRVEFQRALLDEFAKRAK